MQVIRDPACIPDQARGCVVAIGNFDGIHLGHQKLFAEARAQAAASGAAAAVLTFSPHPRRLFNPTLPPFLLASTPVKLDRIAREGMALTVIQRFDRAFAGLSAEEFVTGLLVGRLAVRHVVVGEDYRFGQARRGDVDLLRAMGARHGFGMTVTSPLRDASGSVCSSSRVRAALAEGRPGEAAHLLGQPWEVKGRAVPCADGSVALPLGWHQRPRPGTYAVLAAVDRGGHTRWDAAHPATARFISSPQHDRQAFFLAGQGSRVAAASLRVRVLELLEPAQG
ncbi:bifunctional riboflavin kinase/FAD synthetase [Azospirillum sp. sgz302134]